MRRRCGELQPPERLRRRLEEAQARYRVLEGVGSVLVACSGGPDSVALVHLLWSLQAELGLRLGVAHLNHGLRGAEAEADADYVAALAQRLGLPLVSERVDVAALAQQTGQSLEAAARQARYEFLERARDTSAGGGLPARPPMNLHLPRRAGSPPHAERARGATGEWDRVALGHTASDRVETVLLNLLRGSGLHGLRGMPAARGFFIRPLIAAWREETEAYCAEFDLQPRRDRTNLDPQHAARNRVRLQLLPLLRAEYNPQVDEALLRLAEAVEAELEWTEPEVRARAERGFTPRPYLSGREGENGRHHPPASSLTREEGHGVAVDLTVLAQAPVGLRYRLLREAWRRVTGEVWDLSAADYQALDRLALHSQVGRGVCLPRDIRAEKGYNEIVLTPECAHRRGAPAVEMRVLPAEGIVHLPEIGRELRVERLQQRPAELGQAHGCQIVLDATRVARPLGVRAWQPGDRMVPLGMTGHRKLQDLFTDCKVPHAQRRRVPIVVDAKGEVLWVAGLALAESAKVTEETTEFVRITLR